MATNLRVIVFSPHPDDDVLGCGGILARHVMDGDTVKIVYMTDGRHCEFRTTFLDKLFSIMHHNRFPSPEELIEIRKEEAIAASKELGIPKENLVFLGYEDRSLSNNLETATEKVTQILQLVSPHLIYIPHKNETHVDHIATYNMLKNALGAYSSEILIRQYQVWVPLHEPDIIFNLKDVINIKRKAVLRHKSQLRVKGVPDLLKKVLNNNFEYFKSKRFLA
jgi:LmbE family N-acetylglucosaminyl deacetylase